MGGWKIIIFALWCSYGICTEARSCAEGQYASAGTCADCPSGTYAATPGSADCQPCPTDTFSAIRSATCTSCPVDSTSNGEKSMCMCPNDGPFEVHTSGPITRALCGCGMGFYSSTGYTPCWKCPKGYHTSETNSKSCDSKSCEPPSRCSVGSGDFAAGLFL